MKKINTLLKLVPALTIVGTSVPLITLTGCNKGDSYSVTYGSTPAGLIWLNQPTSVSKDQDLVLTFAFRSGYSLLWSGCSIRTKGSNIRSYCSYSDTTITIPAEYIQGDITITLQTSYEASEYSVSYPSTPDGLTFVSAPETITSGQSLVVEFSLTAGYSLVQSECAILVGTKDVRSSCRFTTSSVTIPSSVITDDVKITLATTSEATEYSITYNTASNITWATDNPTTISSGNPLQAAYTISTSNKIIDPANCKVVAGSTDITTYTSFTGGQINIPGDYVTGKITITLATKTDTFDSSGIPTTTGVTVWTAEEVLALEEQPIEVINSVSHYIYMDATAASNGTISIELSGTLSDTQIICAKKGTYNIKLNGVTISNTNSKCFYSESPILVDNKSAIVNIEAVSGTTNKIYDARTDQNDGTFDSDSCINCKGALTIKGSGTLNINDSSSNKGSYSKGIQVKKNNTLTITDSVKLNVFSLGVGLQSAGTIVLSGSPTVVVTSYYDDGIKTKLDDPDEETAGQNQTRDITIQDTVNLTVYSARNGISSGHDFITTGTPTANIYTSTNAGSKVGTASVTEQNMYVYFPSSSISYSNIENMFFTCTFSNASGSETETEIMTLKKITNSGYYYKCDRPLTTTYTKFQIQQFNISEFPKKQSARTATASSSSFTIKSGSSLQTNDTICMTGISGSTISCSSTTFSKNYKAAIGQTSDIDKVAGSKGIKVKNDINAQGGTYNISSVDTGLQAAYGEIYTNEDSTFTFGQGNISIAGATFNIASSSGDGAKAYGVASVSAGLLNVTNSLEALEGGKIEISNTGIAKLVAKDDGVNASQVGKYATISSATCVTDIQVSGGVLDVQISTSGDTDAIDSNKSMTISGGLVITRNTSQGGGPRNEGSNDASVLDTEEAAKITGGTLIAIGNIEKTPTTSGVTKVTRSSSATPQIYKSGNTYTITYYNTVTGQNATYSFTNTQDMYTTTTIYHTTNHAPSFSQ